MLPDMVTTTLGERLFVGGMLHLYELAHAVLPGDFVSIFTAKRGLRVELCTAKPKAPPVTAPAKGEEGQDADTGGAGCRNGLGPRVHGLIPRVHDLSPRVWGQGARVQGWFGKMRSFVMGGPRV